MIVDHMTLEMEVLACDVAGSGGRTDQWAARGPWLKIELKGKAPLVVIVLTEKRSRVARELSVGSGRSWARWNGRRM